MNPTLLTGRQAAGLAANTVLALGLALALAWPAIELSRGSARVAAIWPVNAALLVLLLHRRPSFWPPMLVGGFAGVWMAGLLAGDQLSGSAALAACNAGEVAFCAFGLRRFAGAAPDLTRQRDFTAFAVVSVLAPVLSGTVAGAYLRIAGEDAIWQSTLTWILADALGLFVLTPALLILSRRRQRRALWEALRSRSKLSLALLLSVFIASILGPWHSAFLLAPPVLVMITIEYELAGAAAAMLALSLFSYALSLTGLEPALLSGTSAERLLKLQAFLAITAAVILPLGAVVSQRSGWRRQLASARDKAEAAAAAKSEFLANMSHELRTPLTSIVGFAGLLRDDAKLTPLQSRYVRRIVDASQALLAVINDVLDFSKLEAGELTLDPQPTDPEELIRQTTELVSFQAEAKGLRLSVITGALPRAVLVDEGRLRQVLLNLLSNAVKITDAGEVRVTAEHLPGAPGRLRVAVSDTGPGVPADRLERLFQRFSQADGSISRRYGGSGLGLAISRRLVELMEGSIWVDTAENRGSTFTFEIASPPTLPQAPPSSGTEPAGAGSLRVLVVDDAAANRELVRTLLEAIGATVSEADDGTSAIARAEQDAFDLILMDVRMPGVDGLAATRAIRAGAGPNAGAPILALTADVQQSDIDACRAAGMNDHIAKPVSVADLVAKTTRWSSGASLAGA